jgi:hypothetical protein
MQGIITGWRQDRQSLRRRAHEANLREQTAYSQQEQPQVGIALRECPGGLRRLDGPEREIYAFLPTSGGA